MPTKRHWSSLLKRFGACDEAYAWAQSQPTAAVAWQTCERGDWMLWIAGRTIGKAGSARHRKVVLAACACARLTLPHVKAGELRPLAAIETAEKWARREAGVTLDDVRKARTAAATAAAAAYAAAAATATAAATAAASAAATAAAAAYATAAASAAAGAARKATWKKCADLVREHIPKPPMPVKAKAKHGHGLSS